MAYANILELACQTPQFRFDWWLRSRSVLDIQRRCHTLIGLVEKEMASLKEAKQEQEKRGRKLGLTTTGSIHNQPKGHGGGTSAAEPTSSCVSATGTGSSAGHHGGKHQKKSRPAPPTEEKSRPAKKQKA